MAAAVVELQRYAERLKSKLHRTTGSPTFSAGVIRGGDNACSVPDWCEVDFDRRTVPGETLETVMNEIVEVLDGIKSRNSRFRYDLTEPTLNIPPFDTPLDSPIVSSIRAAYERQVGGSAELVPFPGSTDAPNLRCPGVICGPGALAQCHSLNEYVAIDEITAAARIYLDTIASLQRA